MIARLALRSIRYEGGRFWSALLGVAAAVGLVVWHVGLANTAINSGYEASRRAAAPYAAWIAGASEGRGGAGKGGREPSDISKARNLPNEGVQPTAEATMGRRQHRIAMPIKPEVLQGLANASEIKSVLPLATMTATIDMRPGGRVLQGPPFRGLFAQLPDSGIPFDVGEVEGRLPKSESKIPEAVVSEALFGLRVPKPAVGSEMAVILPDGTAKLKIVGFFKASNLILAFPSVYMNEAAVAVFANGTPNYSKEANLALINLHDGVNPSIVGKYLARIPQAKGCQLYTVESVAERFRGDTIKNLLSSMPMSLTLAVITASSLLATVLIIGLSLRRRRIAELRCAGMTQCGVARLVLFETMIIVFLGWILGTLFSTLLLQLFLWSERASGELPSIVSIGWASPIAGFIMALTVGAFATILPIRSAVKVRPLEISGGDITEVKPVSLKKSLVAIVLLLPLPLLSIEFSLPENVKSLLVLLIGMPTFIGALIFGIQPLMRLIEFIFLRPLGWILSLDYRLLQRRISRDPARSSGTILTLSLGLGAFIAVHIWGGTLMSSFVPSPEWPDAIVSILPNGLDSEQVEAASICKGIEDGRFLTLDCTQRPIDKKSPAFIGREEEIPKGNILLFGADAIKTFGGDKPMAPFKFVEGTPDSAVKSMAEGKGCVIVAMLSRMGNLHLGDKIIFGDKEFEVAGVVDLNWHMVTSRGLVRTSFGNEGAKDRSFQGRTASMAFVDEKVVRKMTGNIDRTYFLWVDMTKELRSLGGLQAAARLDSELRAAVKSDGDSAIRVHHRDEIADGTLSHGNDILGTMARIPFWSLIVTSTSIVALLIASVNGSRHEFDVMRAIGMTRQQVCRLIFGEALLVTLCSVVLSLISGILIGWSFTGLSRWMLSAGLAVKLIVPWAVIFKGIIFAVALCAIMAILPLSYLTRYHQK